MAEDAICLANYCDIMRCKVLITQDSTLAFGGPKATTDIEVWNEANAFRSALTASGPKEVAKFPNRNFLPSLLRTKSNDVDEKEDDNDSLQSCDEVESSADVETAKISNGKLDRLQVHDSFSIKLLSYR